MYSGEYDACDVTLSVYPHRASLKNMPDHGGNRTFWMLRMQEIAFPGFKFQTFSGDYPSIISNDKF